MYCWGSTVHGELGLGGIEEEQIFSPVPSTWSQASKVIFSACGENHTLLLTSDGKIYACGSNDFGQLGHDLPTKRPQLVSALEAYRIVQMSCGVAHSLAVNEWGQVFGWGSDALGQLGLGSLTSFMAPRILRSLATQQVVQLACGGYHSVALMSNGDIYSWGANTYGQLGLGGFSQLEEKPQIISSLAGVPFAFIAAGGYHTFALTKSGAVYAWGKNTSGQLGLNDLENRCYPSHLKSLRSIKVGHISCGEEFTVFLTRDGGVFTCGSGTYGQLGHGDTKDEMLPRMVMELMGTSVVQALCGRRHLLVLTEGSRLQACGLGASGQLGVGPPSQPGPVTLPRTIKPVWQGTLSEDMSLFRIFAGGDRCLVTLRPMLTPPYDNRIQPSSTQILAVDPTRLALCLALEEDQQVDQDILCYLETAFKSLACLNGSFLLPDYQHYCCNSRSSGIDFNKAAQIFDMISRIRNSSVKEIILQSITSALENLNPNPPDAEALRCFLTLPLYHECQDPRRWRLLQGPLAIALDALRPAPQRLLTAWCHTPAAAPYFVTIVNCFKGVVHHYLKVRENKNSEFDSRIIHVLNAMESLNKINMSNLSKNRVPPDVFYIPDLNSLVNVRQDYLNWLTDSQMNNFYLCNYPFLFDVMCKSSLLELDQAIQMHAAMNQAATQALSELLLHGRQVAFQFVTLNVSREHIVPDTLRELAQYGTSDLKKPLKVKFHNEEAEDAGGVRKEFFMLLLREILDPKYGMFHHYPDTNLVWFAEDSFEEEDMYHLIGVICGLAIYNFTIINVPFPLAMYKKLLRAPVSLEDLGHLSPVMANSLKQLLLYDGDDVEETFCLAFEMSREVYGETRIHALKEGGGNIPVTKENKFEFVDLYVDFIFNKSIEKKFNAFYDGFYKVCGGRVLKLFEPHELMAVVSGNEEYDWQSLQAGAQYRDGYSSQDPNIIAFWEVLHEMSDRDKRNFLLFLTGSDRIPIQGMKAITITIQPTTDDKFLPVAHTCFNLLDLPRYSTKEKLKYKLLQAIQQTEGFSLV